MNIILFCKPESVEITYPYFNKITSSVQRYFSDSCRIQIVESGVDAEQLHKIIDFWRPVGAVVAASSGIGVFSRRNLKPLPVVYLDPPSVSASSFNVVQDNETERRVRRQRRDRRKGRRNMFALKIRIPEDIKRTVITDL